MGKAMRVVSGLPMTEAKRVLTATFACGLLALAAPALPQDVVEYYQLDSVGNVLVVTSAQGAVVEEHDYLPFGEELCGTVPCGAPTGGQPRRFTGKERDAETGLDYFGARYYQAKLARFTTVDPVYTWRDNLVDPQRWNRYAYGRNNPLRYVDPDGREVMYANGQLRTFFGSLSSRSAMVRDTLAQYTGPGRPDLLITHGDAGRDIDGAKNAGVFSAEWPTNYKVDYTGKEGQIKSEGMTAEQIQDLGTWTLVGQVTLTLDSSLTVFTSDKSTIGVALHELGHADHAVRTPLDYKRKAEQVRDSRGRIIDHDKRPAEKIANEYGNKASREVRP
jgi:RHS repeat-associated protein